jgi:hypothetical protein
MDGSVELARGEIGAWSECQSCVLVREQEGGEVRSICGG